MTFENNLKKSMLFAATLLIAAPLMLSMPSLANEDEEHGEEGPANMVVMDAAERKKQGVEILRIAPRALTEEISAPGEVSLNQYKSSQATPRISAQVLSRHVRLGDEVAAGDRLVTLSSVDMAEAQGELIVSSREWNRVKNLGRKVVSARRYIEAQVTAQQAKAKVIAYGLTSGAADQLASKGDASKAVGAFTLYAKQSGTIMSDDFVVGEFVEPGRVLFDIADESGVWVEARLSDGSSNEIKSGSMVRIQTSDGGVYPGTVLQLRHTVDEATRTLSARIGVDNVDDALHAGQFVTAYIKTGDTAPMLAVPLASITLMNGASNVFVLNKNELTPTPVLLGATHGDWVEIKSGLSRGDEIASSQIFLLKSFILKSAIGDSH